jgi:polar amino acid transport system permease protein
MDFSPETMAGWLPYLLGGLWISLKLTAGCIAFGLPLGLVLALAVSSRSRPLRLVSLALVEIGRGTPGLIMLEFVYYGLPQIGLTLGTYVAAIAALSWTTGAYTSEIIRAGLEAVPFGQRQAAIAIGLNPLDRLRFVILPQALRIAVPALLGFAILIFQGTSLC